MHADPHFGYVVPLPSIFADPIFHLLRQENLSCTVYCRRGTLVFSATLSVTYPHSSARPRILFRPQLKW